MTSATGRPPRVFPIARGARPRPVRFASTWRRLRKPPRPDWRKSSNLRSSSSVQILLFFNAIDESTLVDGSSSLAQGGFLRVWRLSQGLRMGDWLRIHWLASPHVGVFKQRPHVGSSVAAGLTGGSTVRIPQIMRTGRKRMLRKRGGQPGNQNAVTHGRHSAPVRAARLAALKEKQAAWREKQRLSDEWIKTVPKTDYAAIALAGKLARQR